MLGLVPPGWPRFAGAAWRRLGVFASGVACLVTLSVSPTLSVSAAGAIDARQAVEAFVNRLAGAQINDVTIQQTVTLYHPDGRFPQSTGEQTLIIKLPARQRVEQTLEGKREVRLTVGDRTWVRRGDGTVAETGSERDRTRVLVPAARSGPALLSEWRALGIREEVTSSARLRGRVVTVIGAESGDRTSPAVWLDPEYGVVRLVAKERLAGGSASLVDLTFSEHRPLQAGFYFPHRQEAFADGRLLLLITVRSVTLNTNPPDGLFDPATLRRER
jgi:outer membrane lipoprotein-sorting protein